MRHIRSIVCFFLIPFFLLSCALPHPDELRTPEERRAARNKCIAMHTLGGAAIGALAGALIKGTKGAIIGAAGGGTLGFAIAWGRCFSLYSDLSSTQVADYSETATRYNYDSSKGDEVKINTFTITPTRISQGNTVQLNGSYYVMTPEEKTDLKVIETRTLQYFDETKNQFIELGKSDNEVTIAPGLRNVDGNIEIHENVPNGRYKIIFKIESQGKTDKVERELVVQQGVIADSLQSEKESISSDTESSYSEKSLSVPSIEVKTKELNVRQSPDRKSQILATIGEGETYPVLEETKTKEKWYKIRVEGIEAWVSGNYVTVKE